MSRLVRGRSPVTIGAVALVITLLALVLAFTRYNPFHQPFEMRAVFRADPGLTRDSPVRIAGLEVGKVTKLEPAAGTRDATVVTMEIEEVGLPVHRDVRLKTRPRLLLEGNFFVELSPGTPSARPLESGATVPIDQTSTPVRLDEVLGVLHADTRVNLRTALREVSIGLSRGGGGFNRATRHFARAYRSSSLVADAMRGTAPHDLSGAVSGWADFSAALDRDPAALQGLIADFDATAGALANRDGALAAALDELPRTLAVGEPALVALDASFPPLRQFAREARPGVESLGPTVDALLPFVREARLLTGRGELGGLAADLRRAVPGLARLSRRTIPLLRQTRAASSCMNEVVLPWANDTVPDTVVPARSPVYQEAVQWLPGAAGESRSGDANFQWFRVLAGGGSQTVSFDDGTFAQALFPPLGTQPAKEPYVPLRPDVACETQERPDLRAARGPAPPSRPSRLVSPAARARADRARSLAVRWLRDASRSGGLGLEVEDRLLTPTELAGSRRP